MGTGAAGGLSGVEFGAAAPGEPGPLHRLERRGTTAQHPFSRLQHALSDPALGHGTAPGLAYPRPHGPPDLAELGAVYGHPIYFLETFIDPERFRGTCYRAANWVVLGRTTGRGKDDQTHRPNRSIKEVLALPLHRRFHELLQEKK